MTCFYITIILPYLKKNNYLQFLNIVYKIPDYLENALLHLVLHLNATSLNTFLLPLLILCRRRTATAGTRGQPCPQPPCWSTTAPLHRQVDLRTWALALSCLHRQLRRQEAKVYYKRN